MRSSSQQWMALSGLLFAVAVHAQTAGELELRNRFDDPFFQISNDLADCPEPLGPRITATELRAQEHHRVERGTSCWLAGQCSRHNSYLYDQDIAKAFKSAWTQRSPVSQTTLWMTVQARVVYLEGCISAPEQARVLEQFAQGIQDVQLGVAAVFQPASGTPPYKLWPSARR
ncbi:hypothetical protein G7047_03840 [Diaphorobacter sp. HDW4A]|uniref:hypothetical protein n=1 Tax=Diaphorobacter sp. HDW4A TaxID=2714924 RepID=UPI0014087B43|nr:hypothetical protein [Diaphorobacter sp. HDW4A]QIL79138.1 hypothetical protein G7047_03840 [Diaphorobacter sp. HDW4A]